MPPPWAAWTPSSSPQVSARTALPERMAIASGLEFMGVKMDEDANKVRGEEARHLRAPTPRSPSSSSPPNEELMIAMDTEALVG